MSDTVNMPAKQDFSLFHNGAETTPEGHAGHEANMHTKQTRAHH